MRNISYSIEVQKKVKEAFDEKRKRAFDEAEARKAEVYVSVPGIRKIDEALSQTGLKVYSEALKKNAQTPLEAEAVPADEQVIPDYQLDPQMEMPVTTIDGVDYIGVLEIPALKLTLPVAGDWSYALLDLAPCRYAGSAYLDDLVILGHNYRGFFRDLSQLQPGDTVFFTDTDGNRFSYAAADFEQLRLSQTEDMLAGDWDLTLFTCTPGAQNRLAVRCLRSDP